MNTIDTLLPIILSVFAGFVCARFLPEHHQRRLVTLIGPLVWVLLFLIGVDFGEVLASASALNKALHTALYFTVFSTLLPALTIAFIYDRRERKLRPRHSVAAADLWIALRSCLLAMAMVALGAIVSLVNTHFSHAHLPLPPINAVLILMIFLVGIDLYRLELKRTHFSKQTFILPLLIIALGLLGSLIAAWLSGTDWRIAMALVSGFGWFTLSSVMVSEALGVHYGTTALLIDLTRELLGIILIYLIGIRYGYMAMSISGAGAMDTVLPIIKTNCGADKIPQALIVGMTLSLLAPLLLGLFLSLSGG